MSDAVDSFQLAIVGGNIAGPSLASVLPQR
jgi:hypothetical protein